MSVVIAISDMQGHAVMASDGMTTRNGNICSLDAKKVYKAGEWLGGCAGLRYLYPMLAEAMRCVQVHGEQDGWEYPTMISKYLKDAIEREGWKEVDDPGYRPTYEVGFLLAHPIHGVWEIEGSLWADLVTLRKFDCYAAATGTGEEAAMGSFFSNTTAYTKPYTLANRAVEVACKIRTDCGGTIFIEESVSAADVETF